MKQVNKAKHTPTISLKDLSCSDLSLWKSDTSPALQEVYCIWSLYQLLSKHYFQRIFLSPASTLMVTKKDRKRGRQQQLFSFLIARLCTDLFPAALLYQVAKPPLIMHTTNFSLPGFCPLSLFSICSPAWERGDHFQWQSIRWCPVSLSPITLKCQNHWREGTFCIYVGSKILQTSYNPLCM